MPFKLRLLSAPSFLHSADSRGKNDNGTIKRGVASDPWRQSFERNTEQCGIGGDLNQTCHLLIRFKRFIFELSSVGCVAGHEPYIGVNKLRSITAEMEAIGVEGK